MAQSALVVTRTQVGEIQRHFQISNTLWGASGCTMGPWLELLSPPSK